MPRTDLMPIGDFARRSGLTPSALRFYADSGLLRPAEVDPASGYRYYSPAQVTRAIALRRLRETAMPLSTVAKVLDAGPEEASRLIGEHVARIQGDAAAARRKAAAVTSLLTGAPSRPVAVVKGPVLADAAEQVLTATAREPGLPVLGGLRIEATGEAVTLTATDRYRLSTRTLVPVEPPAADWAGTVHGDELRAAVAEMRRGALVHIDATPHGVRLRAAGREDQHCRLLSETFPDHRLMLTSLPEVTTRATVAKDAFLHVLEEQPGARIVLRLTDGGSEVRSAGNEGSARALAATVTGQPLSLLFDVTTLYPAVSTAVGPDLMLDLRGPGRPVTFRSADRGDLTTLAMPVRAGHPACQRHDQGTP